MNLSWLEFCERGEWNTIIESANDLIHVWDFDERNADNDTPIHICCAKGSLNVLQHLHQAKKLNFEIKGEQGTSCVALAAKNGHFEILKWAYENGCPLNKQECIHYAKLKNHTHIINWLDTVE